MRDRAGKVSHLVVGYWPLLEASSLNIQAGEMIDDYESALERIQETCPDGRADACIWTANDDDAISPVLVIPQARAIADHLTRWSEGKPSDWFDVFIHAEPRGYAVVLMPRLERSIQRYKTARLHVAGEFVEADEFMVLFTPLAFAAKMSKTFESIQDRLSSHKIHIGLLDKADMSANPPASAIINLGEFERQPTNGGLVKLLERMLPPE